MRTQFLSNAQHSTRIFPIHSIHKRFRNQPKFAVYDALPQVVGLQFADKCDRLPIGYPTSNIRYILLISVYLDALQISQFCLAECLQITNLVHVQLIPNVPMLSFFRVGNWHFLKLLIEFIMLSAEHRNTHTQCQLLQGGALNIGDTLQANNIIARQIHRLQIHKLCVPNFGDVYDLQFPVSFNQIQDNLTFGEYLRVQLSQLYTFILPLPISCPLLLVLKGHTAIFFGGSEVSIIQINNKCIKLLIHAVLAVLLILHLDLQLHLHLAAPYFLCGDTPVLVLILVTLHLNGRQMLKRVRICWIPRIIHDMKLYQR